MKKFSLPRGTKDLLPEEAKTWQSLETFSREIFHIYGYEELRTPIFEEVGLFRRSLGESSEIVQKQMLNLFSDREKKFSLRPEGTAPIIRAYLEHNLDKRKSFAKIYYIGPMFRGERPQKGRLRQFHHIGAEAIGITNPFLDAEIISLAIALLKGFGISEYILRLNSLGCSRDKANLSKILKQRLKDKLANLCNDCQERFERNIFRVMDCKNEDCQTIVKKINLSLDYLCAECMSYFEKVKQALNLLGINFQVTNYLVRGLDYYTHTVFEIGHKNLGSQDALGAGGRYDNLVSQLGGPDLGAVGFALGIERVLLSLDNIKNDLANAIDVFVVGLGELANQKAFLLLDNLRRNKIIAEIDYKNSSLKSQMRIANKLQAKYVLLLGEDEIKKNIITLRNMTSGTQEEFPIELIVSVIKQKL